MAEGGAEGYQRRSRGTPAPGPWAWYPPDETVPLPVAVVADAADPGVSTWYPPTWENPLPVTIVGGEAGVVTSLTAGPGITLTPDPITATGTIALTTPVTVPNGGTGATTATGALANLGAAPLSNAALEGVPTAPTAAESTNTTQIATTAFVMAQIGASTAGVASVTAGVGLTGGGTGAVTVAIATAGVTNSMLAAMPANTLKGNITATAGAPLDLTAAQAMTLLGAAPQASPTFTGTPTGPTAAPGTSTAQLATCAYVKSQNYLTGNETISLTGDATGSGTTSIPVTLATVNPNIGTFNNVTIDAKGLATAGSNAAYLTANQTITLSGDSSGSGTTAIATTTTGLQGHPISTSAPTAANQVLAWSGTQWAPAAAPAGPLTLTGDVTGAGTGAVATTLAAVNGNIGTWNNVTVNAKGLVTAGSNAAYLTSSGVSGMTAGQLPIAATATTITSSVPYGATGTSTIVQTNATGTLAAGVMPAHTGDVTSPAGSTVNTLATVNSNIGTYNSITINAKGLATAGANVVYLTANQTITLSGDVAGSGATAIPATVTQLQGRPLAATLPTANQVIQWSGTQWQPASLAAGGNVTTTALTANQLVLGTGTTAIGSLGSLGTTTTVLHGNAAGAPTFGAVTLTTDVTGTLPIANGGTNATTAAAALTSLGAAPIAGATFTGKVTTIASATGGAGFNLPQGAAPTAPLNGDMWTTTAGVYARINNATVGPLSAAGGTITGVTAGTGLTGGGTTGAVTLALTVPVSVPNGGTGATTFPIQQPAGLGLGRVLVYGNGTNPLAPACGTTGTLGTWGDGSVISSNVGGAAYAEFYRANGTQAAPTAVLANQNIGSLNIWGHNGTTWANTGNLLAYAAENWTTAAQGSYWAFQTTAPGTTTNAERMRLGQGLMVGTTSDGGVGSITLGGASAGVNFLDRTLAPGTAASWWWYANNGVANLYGNGANRLTLDGSGNLSTTGAVSAGGNINTPGIATIGSAVIPSDMPGGTITCGGAAGAGNTILMTAAGGSLVAGNLYYGTLHSNWEYLDTGAGTLFTAGAGNFQWQAAPSGTAQAVATLTNTMLLDGGGNLTIGGSYLHLLNGTGAINGTSTSPFIYADQANIVIHQGTGSGAVLCQNNAGANTHQLLGTGNITISGSVATKATAGQWTAPSSRRLKKDVTDYRRGLDALLRLRPVSYCHNGLGGLPDDGAIHIGLVAEEAEEVMPELVGRMMLKLQPDDDDETEVPTLDPSALQYALINALKDVMTRIEALEAR